MPELSHTFGADLAVSATGDLMLSSGTQEGQERVLRRLLTNPQDYLWDPSYGAGLARFLGQPAVQARIAAISRTQIFKEEAVARSPAPTISVAVQTDGTVIETITYVDAVTGQAVPLTLPIGQ